MATYDFALVFRCNYVSVLHRFRDIVIYVACNFNCLENEGLLMVTAS